MRRSAYDQGVSAEESCHHGQFGSWDTAPDTYMHLKPGGADYLVQFAAQPHFESRSVGGRVEQLPGSRIPGIRKWGNVDDEQRTPESARHPRRVSESAARRQRAVITSDNRMHGFWQA
jgi:hypothetical protein